MDAVRWWVVGVGHEDRQDDGAGPAVARQVERICGTQVEVVVFAVPLDLVDLLAEASEVESHETGLVVVDAVRSGAAPGQVIVHDIAEHTLPPLGDVTGTHEFGLAAAMGLARSMDVLPRRTVVVGVEAEGFEIGAPMSAAVRTAIPDAVRAVLDIVGCRPVVPPPARPADPLTRR